MSRSIKKGPFVQPKLLKRIKEMNEKGEKKVLKTWSRSSTIFPDFVGHTIAVHDGKTRSRIYYGGYGRLQTRRVCSDQKLPRTRRKQNN